MVHDLTDRPIDLAIDPGAVVILTPGPVALTPNAALESARLLLEAARQAMAQRPQEKEDD